ncbi:MAG: 2-amino-4-hydroxy-6-hydroxymethyldihydropteridine pyrophosphokinase [Deltaproteobacteria bacterium]|nr:2-amino-4-hydroxy-6-hydroxymethyldihydropteridine pyrophosphokinase [Deltaproteobacteria bacterium]
MGDKIANLNKAIEELGKVPGNKVVAVSSIYKTEPVGGIEQDWFVNAVAEVETSLTPRELLNKLLYIEKNLGRVRDVKWGPRVIDLDILLYDDLVMDEEGLSIPHPYLHERGFILVPLAEIAPKVIHPKLKKGISELMNGIHDNYKIENIGGVS